MEQNNMTENAGISGCDLVADTLIRLGCPYVFNITGLGMHSLVTSLHKRRGEIGYLSHVNETNLALMAQGYARQTRKPAFCFVYQASGTALSLIAFSTAWSERAPLIIVSTGNSRKLTGREPYAGAPGSLIEMGSQFTKWSYEVTSTARIPEVLARAFAIASEPPMGPVHIAMSSDLFDETIPGAIPRLDFTRTQYFTKDCADEAGLSRIADMLVNARRPVLIAGSEVGQLDAVESLVRLAEALGAPVVLEDAPSYMSFPTSHPQYVGGARSNAALLADSDAIFTIGAEFSEIGDENEQPWFPSKTLLASMSVARLDTTRQVWPDIALSGHPKPSLARLAALIAERGVSEDVRRNSLADCAKLREQRRSNVAGLAALDRNASPVPPSQLIDEIRKFCQQDWIIMQAGSTAGFLFDSIYEFDNPANFHALSSKGSAQGWGAPVSIGVQMAAPGKRVLTLIGDGNLMFSATALWATVKNKLPMIFVVINNGGWASIPSYMRIYGKFDGNDTTADEMGWTFGEAPVDYVSLARAFGLRSALASTAAELADRLTEAGASYDPWLIEVTTAFTPF